MPTLLLKGFLIGFAIAAPVGPIGILCIQRSLRDGFQVGLMTGMGAALADGTYGLIAGFGLTAVSSLLIAQQFLIRILGGVFLLYLGLKLMIKPVQERESIAHSDRSPWHACGTTYLLTLTNPATILSFIAIFAGLGLGTTHPDFMHAVTLVSGIILGSAVWWLFLSGCIAIILRKRITPLLMQIIHWLSGSILLAFGLFALKVWV
jgi:threonine/homoserine/homoserine lactone efflux protein